MSVEFSPTTTSPETRHELSIEEQALVLDNGTGNIETFASNLPDKSMILHIGTSLNDAGMRVAELRGDMQWYNLDPSYKDGTDRYNYEYIKGDIDVIGDQFGAEFERIYCYGQNYENLADAQAVSDQLFQYLRPGGIVQVGPLPENLWAEGRYASRILSTVKPHPHKRATQSESSAITVDACSPLSPEFAEWLDKWAKKIENARDIGSRAVSLARNSFSKLKSSSK